MTDKNYTKKAVTFLGNTESVFVTRTAEKLRSIGYEVILIDLVRSFVFIENKGRIFKFIRLFHRAFKYIRLFLSLEKGTTVIIHSLLVDTAYLSFILRLKFKKIVVVAYGSDILRRNKRHDWLFSLAVKNVDHIAATNTNVIDEIVKSFGDVRKRTSIVRFALPVLDSIDNLLRQNYQKKLAKKVFGFCSNKAIICLGYSASAGQRQSELIDFFINNSDDFKNVKFVVPLQYGGNYELRKQLKEKCSGYSNFIVFTEFHDIDKTAAFRLATDVLINHSITDSFSGTVQEVLYAGGIVMYQSSLPYEKMPGNGARLIAYNNLDEISSILSDFSNITETPISKEFLKIRQQISSLSGPDAAIQNWVNLIET